MKQHSYNLIEFLSPISIDIAVAQYKGPRKTKPGISKGNLKIINNNFETDQKSLFKTETLYYFL